VANCQQLCLMPAIGALGVSAWHMFGAVVTLGLGGNVGGFSGGSWKVWLIFGDGGFVIGCSGNGSWPSVLGSVLRGVGSGGSGSDGGPCLANETSVI
jgi:hypothetical protein